MALLGRGAGVFAFLVLGLMFFFTINVWYSCSQGLFRSGWELGQDHHVDPKVVGSHLPLGKRNSTPVGVASSSATGTPSHHHYCSPLKIGGTHLGGAPPCPATQGDLNLHRALDRCHSEPVKPAAGAPQQQQSGPGTPVTSSSRYKTELCRPFAETGFCKYGEKCQFAHGAGELRNMPRHPKYKTELCRTFHTTGLCGYGTRCHFIHNADERRYPSPLAFGPGGLRSPSEDPADLTPPPISTNLSPPASLHGSPTSTGAFFGDSFSLGPPMGGHDEPHHSPFSLLNLETLETPPVSPVESLSGDIENLSLSPALSDSPSPPSAALSAFLEGTRYPRLPIFQSLKEAM